MKRKKVSSHTPGRPIKALMLFIGFMVAMLHVFILRTIGAEDASFPIAMMGLILFFDAMLLWWAIIFTTQSRVTLFEEGIELQQGGAKVFTTWDNVSHLGIKGFGRNQRRGLFLHEKVTPEVTGIVDRLFFGWRGDFLPIGRYVNLPRNWNPFSRDINREKLLNTEFGENLYSVAPHLFEEYDEWKPKNRLEDGYADESQPDWLADMQASENRQK